MKRREFIALISAAAAVWPVTPRAQQAAMPVVGYLDSRSPEAVADRLRGFRQGLKESGYIENENVAIAYRWAENQPDRLQELATDLVRRRVAVIATAGPPATFAAKAATSTIHSLLGRRRSSAAWPCREPRAAGRQPDRNQYFQCRVGGKAA